MRKAAIIPLDYTRLNQPTRKEHSISLFSDNWNDLGGLLTDPIGAMATLGNHWPQDFPGAPSQQPIDWTLVAPVDARLEYLLPNLAAVLKVANLTLEEQQVRSAVAKANDARKSWIDSAKPPQVPPIDVFLIEALLLLLQDSISAGCFLAEFAPQTSALHILYSPPVACLGALIDSATNPTDLPSATGRMNKPFTRATLGLIGPDPTTVAPITHGKRAKPEVVDAGTATSGTVHFDIGMSHEDRADFIMDHLENSARTCQMLNQGNMTNINAAGDKKIYMKQLTFYEQWQPIPIGELILVNLAKPFNIVDDPSTLPAKPKSESALLPTPATYASLMPTVSVENLSDPTDTYVCGQGIVCAMNSYQLQELTLKDYVPPTPGG